MSIVVTRRVLGDKAQPSGGLRRDPEVNNDFAPSAFTLGTTVRMQNSRSAEPTKPRI